MRVDPQKKLQTQRHHGTSSNCLFATMILLIITSELQSLTIKHIAQCTALTPICGTGILLTSFEIAASAQTEYCPTFHCPCVCHRRDISPIQGHKCHVIHQGTHQTLYILNQNHSGYLSSKDQTRQDHLLHPDQPNHWF